MINMNKNLLNETFQKHLKLLYKKLNLNEINFNNSPDEDNPGNKQIVVFKEDDKYDIPGNTHGSLSHAIKHFGEFDPNSLNSQLNGAINYIKTLANPILKNVSGVVIASGDNAKKQLTPNAVLNTFDFINDKVINNQELNTEETEIKTKFLDKLNVYYDKLVQDYISGGIDINNMKSDEIKKLISSNKKIKFKGSYHGHEYEYILDFSNAGLLVKNEDNVSTLFRIDKKGNDINKIGAYLSRGVEIANVELKKALNIQN